MKKEQKSKTKKHNTRNFLKKLEIEITEQGFTVWTVDKVKREDGKFAKIRHWLVDASCLKKDGLMRFGVPKMYKTEARINVRDNNVQISKK